MKIMKTYGFIFFFLIYASLGFSQQQRGKIGKVSKKDNPTVVAEKLPVSKEMKKLLGDSLIKLLASSDVIEAYHLKESSIDTTETAFLGSTVLAKKMIISKTEKDSLVKIITTFSNYGKVPTWKKCEFNPSLGFRFVKKGKPILHVLIALNCDVLQFIVKPKKEQVGMDIDLAHTSLMNLGATIFPNQKYFEQNNH
jgi:hypothetical protein